MQGTVVNLVLIKLLFLLSGCTGNPFGGNEISGGRKQIDGQVMLNDGATSDRVFVWLSDYNVATYTDETGVFSLRLPPRPTPDTVTGTIERHTLYFYLANYLIETAEVMVVDGEFFYDRGDIDKNGKVRGPIVLRRLLQINTEVNPSVVQADSAVIVFVETHLQTDIGCAEVGVPKVDQIDRRSTVRPLGAILAKQIDTEEVFVVQADPAANGSYLEIVCRTIVTLDLQFDFSDAGLPPGEYEVIPYLFINPPGVPNGLLEKLGSHVNDLGPNYLKKPLRRKDGQFKVTN